MYGKYRLSARKARGLLDGCRTDQFPHAGAAQIPFAEPHPADGERLSAVEPGQGTSSAAVASNARHGQLVPRKPAHPPIAAYRLNLWRVKYFPLDT